MQELVPDGVSDAVLHYRDGQSQPVAVSNNLLRFAEPVALERPVRATELKIDEILGKQLANDGRSLNRQGGFGVGCG